jgi:hypothetical protein
MAKFSLVLFLAIVTLSVCCSVFGSPAVEGPRIGSDRFLDVGEGTQGLKIVAPEDMKLQPKSEQSILIIYNHGSISDDLPEMHCNFLNRLISFRTLLQVPIEGARVWIYVKCTNNIAGDLENPEERDFPESYLCVLEKRKTCFAKKYKEYKRREEILRTVLEFQAQGFSAKRIFLMGHSCGGWQSMILASQYPELIAGAIAIDPGCYGTTKWQATRPNYSRLRRIEIQLMRQASNWDGLVFTNADSPCCNPATLDWLANMPRITRLVTPAKVRGRFIVEGKVCNIADINGRKIRHIANGHQLSYSPCFSSYIPKIQEFIQKRIK